MKLSVTLIAACAAFALIAAGCGGDDGESGADTTVTTGLYGTFQFDAPGTYPVREDISGNTATITVAG